MLRGHEIHSNLLKDLIFLIIVNFANNRYTVNEETGASLHDTTEKDLQQEYQSPIFSVILEVSRYMLMITCEHGQTARDKHTIHACYYIDTRYFIYMHMQHFIVM